MQLRGQRRSKKQNKTKDIKQQKHTTTKPKQNPGDCLSCALNVVTTEETATRGHITHRRLGE